MMSRPQAGEANPKTWVALKQLPPTERTTQAVITRGESIAVIKGTSAAQHRQLPRLNHR